MIRSTRNLIYVLIFLSFLFGVSQVFAQTQDSLKLSITPPLFKVNMNPGETWSSAVKLVNNNSYPLTIYAQVADFKSGASGGVEFIKDSGTEKNSSSLSGWVEISREPVVIGPQQSAELPFTIKLPPTAGPGGHYAAILAGSKPPEDKLDGSAIKISSMLASLILVRVSGEVVERGEIREFSVDRRLSGDMSAKLKAIFTNTGNTHLQPQGEIKITNFWGETRGVFPINQKSSFGNVLPDSDKSWEYFWRGSSTIMDAGRMRAEMVISFGDEAKQTDARTIYFWTFDLKPTAITLGTIIFILLLIILLIRRYINKSLRQVRAQAELLLKKEKELATSAAFGRPVAAAPSDFNEDRESAQEQISWSLFKRIAIFIIIVILAALIVIAFYYFGVFQNKKTPRSVPASEINKEEDAIAPLIEEVQTASSSANGVPLIEEKVSGEPATSSESTSVASSTVASTTTEQKIIKIKIENGGGVRGAAAKAAGLIKATGTEIISLGNAANFDYQTTEIRYQSGLIDQAEAIKLLLGGTALLIEDPLITADVLLILGRDFK